MSGGRFGHLDAQLKTEIFGWDGNCSNIFEDLEISELVYDMLDLISVFDWYDSGDTSEEVWLQKKKAFKEKWLKNDDDRVKNIVDKSIEKLRKELYQTYDIKENKRNE